jgi:hypothetical protein
MASGHDCAPLHAYDHPPEAPSGNVNAALTVHAFCSAHTVYMTALCPLWNTVFWGVTTDQTGHYHQSGLPSEGGLIETSRSLGEWVLPNTSAQEQLRK